MVVHVNYIEGDFMNDKKKEKKERKNILDNIKDYSPSIIGVLTFLGIICFNILKFTEYIKVQFYFNYYGLDDNLYKYSDQSLIYGLCLSVIFVLAIFSLLFCIKQLLTNLKDKRYFNKQNFKNFGLIIVSNIYIAYCYSLDKSIGDIVVTFFVCIIVELLFFCFIFSKINDEQNDTAKSFIDYLKLLPFYIVLLIITIGIGDTLNVNLRKDYRIINDNKVIVYSNNDYYLTLDCEVKKDKLIIYKGKQNKINTDNVRSELINFDKVEIK